MSALTSGFTATRVKEAIKRWVAQVTGREIYTRAAQRLELERIFRARQGMEADLDNPVTYNQKLVWFKHHVRDPRLTVLADKLGMREHVENVLGPGHTTRVFGVWRRAEDIDFTILPERFVLKFNAASGTNYIHDGSKPLDEVALRALAAQWLDPRNNYFFDTFEWCYRDIPPRVFAEEYLVQDDGDLHDYKFFCFDGVVRCAYITSHVDGEPRADYFDRDGNSLPFERLYPRHEVPAVPPPEWETMVEYAERLSQGHSQVRVDFFMQEGRIIVGEFTFYSGDAVQVITPREWDYWLGEHWVLPKRSRFVRPFELVPIGSR